MVKKASSQLQRSQTDVVVNLPVTVRRSTDCLFFLLIISSWIAMTLIGLCAIGYIKSPYIRQGNPDLLLHGVDYQGNICGVDEAVKGLPKKWFPNFYATNTDSNGVLVPPLFAICVSSCPSAGERESDPYGEYGSWASPYDTFNVLNDCLYESEIVDDTSGISMLSDFFNSAEIIALLGFVLAVGASMVFLFLARIPLMLRTLVWTCITVILVLLVVGGYTLLSHAKEEGQNLNKTEVTLLNFVGSVLSAFALIWLCVMCFMRQRIALAIGLIKESAHALVSMPLLCFMPLFQAVIFAGFTVIWLVYSFYLVSSGDITTHTDEVSGLSYQTVSFDEHSQRAIAFMFFCWLWTVGFLEAMNHLISSHAVLTWYFAESRSQVTSLQVFSSMYQCVRYHSGTAAAGSLIIALLRGVRITFEYMKQKLSKRSCCSCLVKMILCSISCLLFIFEKCIKFLNKHSYIQCALYGTAFFPSARRAFSLIVRHLGRLAAVSMVGDFVVLVGKLTVTLSCSFAAYYYMTTYMEDELQSFILPTIFVACVAFVVSTLFLGVLSATADALMQACIVDEETETRKSKGKEAGLRDLVVVKKDQWRDGSYDDDAEIIAEDKNLTPEGSDHSQEEYFDDRQYYYEDDPESQYYNDDYYDDDYYDDEYEVDLWSGRDGRGEYGVPMAGPVSNTHGRRGDRLMHLNRERGASRRPPTVSREQVSRPPVYEDEYEEDYRRNSRRLPSASSRRPQRPQREVEIPVRRFGRWDSSPTTEQEYHAPQGFIGFQGYPYMQPQTQQMNMGMAFNPMMMAMYQQQMMMNQQQHNMMKMSMSQGMNENQGRVEEKNVSKEGSEFDPGSRNGRYKRAGNPFVEAKPDEIAARSNDNPVKVVNQSEIVRKYDDDNSIVEVPL